MKNIDRRWVWLPLVLAFTAFKIWVVAPRCDLCAAGELAINGALLAAWMAAFWQFGAWARDYGKP